MFDTEPPPGNRGPPCCDDDDDDDCCSLFFAACWLRSFHAGTTLFVATDAATFGGALAGEFGSALLMIDATAALPAALPAAAAWEKVQHGRKCQASSSMMKGVMAYDHFIIFRNIIIHDRPSRNSYMK